MIPYIVHFCRNRDCQESWLDTDMLNSKTPPKWRYCPACQMKGYSNPEAPPKNRHHSDNMAAKWRNGQIQGRPKKALLFQRVGIANQG